MKQKMSLLLYSELSRCWWWAAFLTEVKGHTLTDDLRAAFPPEHVSSDENEILTPDCGFFAHFCVSFAIALWEDCGLFVFRLKVKCLHCLLPSWINTAHFPPQSGSLCQIPWQLKEQLTQNAITVSIYSQWQSFSPKIINIHYKYTMNALYFKSSEHI